MKRIVSLLLTFFLIFSLSACVVEEYSGLQSSKDSSVSSSSDSSGVEDSSSAPSQNTFFQVQLTLDEGEEMPPLDGVQAVWTGKSNVYTAPFDQGGLATSDKPDGEYAVTLSKTPEGYTYDPNVYRVSNASKKVEITLYKIREMTGNGAMTDSGCFKLPSAGTYRFTFEKPEQRFGFTFVPTLQGTYRFSTMMDVTANEITASFYKHAVQFINPQELTDTQGAITNTYTKNFIVNVDMAEDEISQAHYFSIQIHSLSEHVFPINVDMRLERLADYVRPNDWEIVETPDIPQTPEVIGKAFELIGLEHGRVLDQRYVGSYSQEGTFTPLIGSDGYYRVDKGAANVDDNPILYAKLEGTIAGILETGMNDPQLRKKCGNVKKDYDAFYNAHLAKVNSEGCVPVTNELKEFLYNLSVSNQYFWDGNGWAETNGGYQSDEESQWLFACGYYK